MEVRVMIGATIDIYHDEISAAVGSGDNRRLAEIAACFYERHSDFKPWRLLDCRVEKRPGSGVAVIIEIQFVAGKRKSEFATVVISYEHGKQRVVVEGETFLCSRMDQAVDVLDVPMAFLDGLYFFAQHFDSDVHSNIGKSWLELQRLAAAASAETAHRDRLSSRVRELERRVQLLSPTDGHNKVTYMDVSVAAGDLRSKFLSLVPTQRPSEISDAKKATEGRSGIYFAWCVASGKCVYVGKSKNLGSRLSSSRHELRGCRVTFLEMPEAEIHLWELFYIWLLKPERNGQVVESQSPMDGQP
jgi:hypothetical protein